jgi:hypothetical protein
MHKLFLALAAVVALLASPADAVHCKEPTLNREAAYTFKDPTSGKVYYVENDRCQTEGCTASFYIYEETNGYANLQRQDATGAKADEWTQDDTCHGKIRPDTLVF